MDDQVVTALREQGPSECLIAALRLLLERDSYLLEVDANERSISHRLGLHLQSLLPDWDVDCEYNRDGVDPKRIGFLGLHPDDEDTEAKTVFPDIIIHQRGTNTNHLVIEIKKVAARLIVGSIVKSFPDISKTLITNMRYSLKCRWVINRE